MSGLRFCMLTTFYPPLSFGGDAIGVQRLSRALVRRGHHVTVVHDANAFEALHRGPVPPVPDEDDDQGVRVLRLRSRLGRLGLLLTHQTGHPVPHARRLRALLAPGQWDVVNFHNVSLLGAPGLLHYPREAVTLYMAHEHWLVCPTHVLWRHRRERCDRRECLRCSLAYRRPPQLWRYGPALARGLRRIDAVIAMSEFSRAKHREFGLERDMEVLPCFLPDVAAPEEGPEPGRPHSRPYFFFAGRLERIKGLDDVIPVFKRFRDADLLIAGDGEHGPTLRALAADHPHVRFLGKLTPAALRAYYRHAIAVLVPSVCFETFGIVVIEAFRQGTPVIARRLGPFPELLEQSGAGELFATAEELEAVLHRFLEQPGLRPALSSAGRSAFQSHWTEAAVVPAYLDIVSRAATRRGYARITDALTIPEVV